MRQISATVRRTDRVAIISSTVRRPVTDLVPLAFDELRNHLVVVALVDAAGAAVALPETANDAYWLALKDPLDLDGDYLALGTVAGTGHDPSTGTLAVEVDLNTVQATAYLAGLSRKPARVELLHMDTTLGVGNEVAVETLWSQDLWLYGAVIRGNELPPTTLTTEPETISADTTLTAQAGTRRLIGDTGAGNVIVTLHAGAANSIIWAARYTDPTGEFRLRPKSGETINGSTADLVLTAPGEAVVLWGIPGEGWLLLNFTYIRS